MGSQIKTSVNPNISERYQALQLLKNSVCDLQVMSHESTTLSQKDDLATLANRIGQAILLIEKGRDA